MQRLIGLDYHELSGYYQHRINIDRLGNAPLQQHMIAMETLTLESAIQASNDFTQKQTTSERTRVIAKSVDGPEEDPLLLVWPPSSTSDSMDTLQCLMEQVQCIAEIVKQLQRGGLDHPGTRSRRTLTQNTPT